MRRPALPLLVVCWLLLASAPAAAAPRVAFEPPELTFAVADPRPSERTVAVRNVGDTPLHLAGIFLSPDSSGFHVDSPGPTELVPGAAVQVTVRYTPGRLPRDATGAMLVVSDDPRGPDDPRTDEPDHVVGLPLRVGGTAAALGLFAPPLVAALLLAGLGAVGPLGQRRSRAAAWLVRLALAAQAIAAAWLARGFQPELTARDGGYGIQRVAHHVLSAGLALEYFIGFDGLSLPLVVLVALWGVLAARPRRPGPLLPSAAWRLLLLGGTLLALGALDVGLLAAGWLLALLGASGELGCFQRTRPAGARTLGLCLAVTLGLLVTALALARARSLPTALVDGTFVAHIGDLIKLSYQNFFGDQRLLGLALDRALWLALQAAALLPLAALLVVAAPAGQRLLVAVPLAVLALYAGVRLGGGLFPHAARALLPWLGGLGLLGAGVGALRALRAPSGPALLASLLTAQLAATALGLSAGTQAGLHAALLGLWRFALGALLLGLGPTGGAATRGERLLERGTTLLVLGAPGLLGFPAQVLLLVGTAPTQRLATGALLALWLLAIGQAARRAFERTPRAPERPSGPSAPLAPRLVALGLAVALGLWPQVLITASTSWVNDAISHTVGHLGPAALALLQAAGARPGG